jgi:hypothetical protein
MKGYPLTLQDLQDTATQRGGACLSKVYLGSMVKHLWRCARGHEWRATPNRVRVGSWCLDCWHLDQRTNYRLTIKDLQGAAKARRGQCLNAKYEGLKCLYRWRCAAGHEWEDSGFNVRHLHRWCSICSK